MLKKIVFSKKALKYLVGIESNEEFCKIFLKTVLI